MQARTSSAQTNPLAVIMSVYEGDVPKLFERALQSVLGQDWSGSQIRIYLCVDGQVAPAIDEVIARHLGAMHKVVRNDERRGLATSLNTLLDLLDDEDFVFRMDSDDYSHPNRLSRQMDKMLSEPSIDILGSAINEVDLDGRVVNTVRYPVSRRDIFLALPRRNPIAHPSVCFRRSAIGRFKHYPITRINQDWALWYRCVSMGMVLSNLDEVLLDMTVSDAFFRRRGFSRAYEEFKISMRGTWSTHGITWRMVYPFLRALFRLVPANVSRIIYRSPLR